MAGNKRYSPEEIKRIVELKNSGKSSLEVCEILKAEFNTLRVPNSINFTYNRFKGASSQGGVNGQLDKTA